MDGSLIYLGRKLVVGKIEAAKVTKSVVASFNDLAVMWKRDPRFAQGFGL